jgi:hypothetical protein
MFRLRSRKLQNDGINVRGRTLPSNGDQGQKMKHAELAKVEALINEGERSISRQKLLIADWERRRAYEIVECARLVLVQFEQLQQIYVARAEDLRKWSARPPQHTPKVSSPHKYHSIA